MSHVAIDFWSRISRTFAPTLLSMLAVIFVSAIASTAAAQTAAPKADKPGSADDPLLKRYSGSLIVMHERKAFTDMVLPLGKLEPAPRDAPEGPLRATNSKTVEGQRTHFIYYVGKDRSPLEVARNYQDEVKAQGGRILYECKDEACGGSPTGNVQRGEPGMISFLYPRKNASEKYGAPSYCAMDGTVNDLRYSVLELGGGRGYASIAAYSTSGQGGTCGAFDPATFVTVDLVEVKAREQRMVTVKSTEMADALQVSGKVALYGIYFDVDKATLKSESDATLEQIGKLMKEKPSLKLLVVGHTDNAGNFAANMDLSQRRAAAVVGALTGRYDVKQDRLTAIGVSFAAPVASNKSEEGRAKNRRVELVEN
jgi:outer membrane protein OmpA-like peptidoglycan-associated protein